MRACLCGVLRQTRLACLDMVCSSLERPEVGLWTHPREASRAMAQESMFWEIVSENVLDALDKNVSADNGREWREKKKMEKSTGTAWTDLGWSQRSLQLRECALRDVLAHSGGRQTLLS